MKINQILINQFKRFFSLKETSKTRRATAEYISGNSEIVKDTKDVNLRGVKLTGLYRDLPALIFFPDIFDSVENWMSFFANSNNPIINHRDVYILYPRNQGTSDWCNENSSEPAEDLVDDIERFMYLHKLTSATIGGHGFGAKNALLAGCYKPNLVTGILAMDWAPQNYHYFRAGHSLKSNLDVLKSFGNIENMNFEQFKNSIKKEIQCFKTQAMLEQQFKLNSKGKRYLQFNLDYLRERFEDIVSWKFNYGLFGGRTRFIFPEYSQMVFLNSNTLSIMKVCVQNRGYQTDIKSLSCDNNDNPEVNHWIYENQSLLEQASYQSCEFLQNYDGVNVLLKNRSEIMENISIPVQRQERKDNDGTPISPSHFHHNWRFTSNTNHK